MVVFDFSRTLRDARPHTLSRISDGDTPVIDPPRRGRRKVATVPTGELIDRYGRLLAYLAPWFSGSARDPLPPRDDPQRRTFNLDMVEAGWGRCFSSTRHCRKTTT
jgi:hypothetical protein